MAISKTYILADKLGDCYSTNLLLDTFIDVHRAINLIPGPNILELIDQATTPTSPLRQLCIHVLAHTARSSVFQPGKYASTISDFFVEVLKEKAQYEEGDDDAKSRRNAIRRKSEGETIMTLKKQYHQHDGLHPKP